MAKWAALVDAQRILLISKQIKAGPNQSPKSNFIHMPEIQGFIQGYRATNECELSDGKVKIELELSLTGSCGLSRYIIE